MNAWKHLKTILHHKNLVRAGCFRIGLYKQGMLHDLSKYSPTEFLVGCRFYQGNMSPNNAEREAKGYSAAWLHHKGRNKHHMEYWIDYSSAQKKDGTAADAGEEHKGMCGMKMPIRYVAEMYVDRVSASKNYQKDLYTNDSPLIYYEKGKEYYVLHPDTRALLELLLVMLSLLGEKETDRFIRCQLLKGQIAYEKDVLDEKKYEIQKNQTNQKNQSTSKNEKSQDSGITTNCMANP